MFGGDLEINVVEVNNSDLSIHSDTGREKENPLLDTSKSLVPLSPCQNRGQKGRFTMVNEKSNGFMGNVERSIKLGKAFPATATAEKPVKVGTLDGATMFTVKMGVIVDTAFPTKAGNTTTALIMVPLDGGKVFPIDGGTVKMDGIAPFIYQGRGASHVFTMYADNGDVVKRKSTRKSASAEVAELKKQLDAIMTLLSKK